MQKRLVHISPLFVTHSQSPKLIQPSEGRLHHPPPSAQSAAVFGIAFCKKRNNASVPQVLPNRFGIIPAVAHNTIRTVTRASALSLQKQDGIHQGERLRRVVTVRPSELNGSGIPLPSQIRCRLLPSLARSVELGPVSCPQKPLLSSCHPPPQVTNQSALCDERASLRNSAEQVRCKTGGLGISVEALLVRASEVNLQSLPKSARQSGPSERAGSLLCAT